MKSKNTIGKNNLSRGMDHASRAARKEVYEKTIEDQPITVEEGRIRRLAEEAEGREYLKKLRDNYAAHEAHVRGLELGRGGV